MRHFNAPPGWPEPPNARWKPPKNWAPEEDWPPAPLDWPFWIDGEERRVRGPIGRYGAPSLAPLAKVAGGLLSVCVLVLFVLFGPFSGSDDTTQETGSPSATDTGLPPPPTVSLLPPGETTATPTVTPTPGPTPLVETVSPTPSTVSPSTSPDSPTTTPPTAGLPTPTATASTVSYQNCAQVRAAGKAPLYRGDPGYSLKLDKNGDGVACERGTS